MSCRRLAVRAAAVAVVAVLVPAGPAGGRQATPGPAAEADIDVALDDVEVDGIGYRLVAADYERARAARRAAATRLAELVVEERELAAALARARVEVRRAAAEVRAWAARVADLAVQAYIGAGQDDDVVAAGLDPGYNRSERRVLMAGEVDRHWQATLAAREALLELAEAERDRLRLRHDAVVADVARTRARRDEARAEERRLRPTVQQARATATVVGSDLTLVALDAYLRAALETGGARPECGLPWWLLAGIGRVESGHGTFATSTLDPAGTARPAIIGIALDGGRGTAVITDTDGGTLDGDRVSDRAVGPMQFIPSTWAAYAVDGNGDGAVDPQNLYDASRAAADYLCTAGGDLRTDAGVQRAVFAYNHSQSYVDTVLGFAAEYRTLLR